MPGITHKEDIYDFDDTRGKSGETGSGGGIFSKNEIGNLTRPVYRPRVYQEKVAKLPPVLVGQPRPPARRSDLTTMSKPRQVKLTTSNIGDINKHTDWHRERTKLTGPRQPQKECPSQLLYKDPGFKSGPRVPLPPCGQSTNAIRHIPAPPTSRPVNNQSFSKNTRQVRNMNVKNKMDTGVQRVTLPCISNLNKAQPPLADFIDDLDRELDEAVEMDQKYVSLKGKAKKATSHHGDCFGASDKYISNADVDDLLNELDGLL